MSKGNQWQQVYASTWRIRMKGELKVGKLEVGGWRRSIEKWFAGICRQNAENA